jgi:SAM-dependent methyltransferase
MIRSDAQFSNSIAEAYERFLVPLLFRPYAGDLVERARAFVPRRILEVAAGTGVVTRELARSVPDAKIEATDLNAAMVDIGAALVTHSNVHWSVADAAMLPFEDHAFDLLLCQFGVMFFPNREAAFREARRVLDEGGTFLFSVWDGLDHNDVARIVSKQAALTFPNDPPVFLQRTPYGHGDTALITRDLQAAGFTSVSFDTVTQRHDGCSARDAAVGMCTGTPLSSEILQRSPEGPARVIDSATDALSRELGGDLSRGAMQAHVFIAR